MIPVQDVVPSGRRPLATLALLAAHVVCFVLPLDPSQPPAAWFGQPTPLLLVTSMWWLWLFGDNVEARLGRVTFVAIYAGSTLIAAQFPPAMSGSPAPPGLGVVGGVTGIMGAYFMLLPRARVLMFVPAPPALVEAPALFFLSLWWVLQFLQFVVAPAAARLELGGGLAMWALAAALLFGAGVCRVMRRPVEWR